MAMPSSRRCYRSIDHWRCPAAQDVTRDQLCQSCERPLRVVSGNTTQSKSRSGLAPEHARRMIDSRDDLAHLVAREPDRAARRPSEGSIQVHIEGALATRLPA